MDQASSALRLRSVALANVDAPARHRSLATVAIYVSLALLIVGIVALQTFHFRDRNYRQDEIITAHAGTFRSPGDVVQWMAFDIHPPLWRVAATQWVALVGQHENMTRFFSTLLTILTLSFVFRLAADLFNWRVGLFAVFILGTLAYFQFYSHEFRPYPALMLFSVASLLALLRWIRHPNGLYAGMFVFSALGAMYTHYFGLFVVAGEAALFLVMARPRPGLYLRFFGLLVAIGIGYLPWLPVILHTAFIQRPDGVNYAYEETSEGLQKIYEAMMIRPDGLGLLLVMAAIASPVVMRNSLARGQPVSPLRFGIQGSKLYLLVFAILMVGLTATANEQLSILTRRNLSPLTPVLSILAAVGLWLLPGRLRIAAIVLLLIPAVFTPVSMESNAPYREVVQAIGPTFESGDRIVLHVGSGWWQWEVAQNYLADRLPIDDPTTEIIRVEDTIPSDEPQPTAYIDHRLGNASRVWFFGMGTPSNAGQIYKQVIAQNYALLTHREFFNRTFSGDFYLDEYARIPEPRSNIAYGDSFELVSWRLLTPVDTQACDWVTVEHWWRADEKPDDNYNTSLDLVASTGIGIARTNGEPAGLLTLQWEPNRLYMDTRSVPIPCDTPPGDYSIMVTMYDYDATPLTARLSDGTELGGIAYLTTIHVRE